MTRQSSRIKSNFNNNGSGSGGGRKRTSSYSNSSTNNNSSCSTITTTTTNNNNNNTIGTGKNSSNSTKLIKKTEPTFILQQQQRNNSNNNSNNNSLGVMTPPPHGSLPVYGNQSQKQDIQLIISPTTSPQPSQYLLGMSSPTSSPTNAILQLGSSPLSVNTNNLNNNNNGVPGNQSQQVQQQTSNCNHVRSETIGSCLFSPYPNRAGYYTRSKAKQAPLYPSNHNRDNVSSGGSLLAYYPTANSQRLLNYTTTTHSNNNNNSTNHIQLSMNNNNNASSDAHSDNQFPSSQLQTMVQSEEDSRALAASSIGVNSCCIPQQSPDDLDIGYLYTEDALDSFALIKALRSRHNMPSHPLQCPLTNQKLPFALPPLVPSSSNKITLVLDLDETLVHCSTDRTKMPVYDLHFTVTFQKQLFNVYVRTRPYLMEFLQYASDYFEIVIFTASQQIYADKLLDLLDPEHKYTRHRLFRDSCVNVAGTFVKDLRVLGRDLSKVIIVDNAVEAFTYQLENGVPIKSWFADNNSDEELVKLYRFLYSMTSAVDVRPLLRRKFAIEELIETSLQPETSEEFADENVNYDDISYDAMDTSNEEFDDRQPVTSVSN